MSVNWRDAFTEDELEAERQKHREETANKRKGNGVAEPKDDEEAGWAEPKPETPWPAPLGDDAYHGVIGDFVRAVEPHTEADPAALLVQAIVFVGNSFGRKVCFFAEDASIGR